MNNPEAEFQVVRRTSGDEGVFSLRGLHGVWELQSDGTHGMRFRATRSEQPQKPHCESRSKIKAALCVARDEWPMSEASDGVFYAVIYADALATCVAQRLSPSRQISVTASRPDSDSNVVVAAVADSIAST